MNKRQLGTQKERLAGKLLMKNGYEIISFNYRCRFGEIDIIAKENDMLVFVEVKYRSNEKMGMPQEAVDIRKQHKIIQVARYYCLSHGLSQMPCRFDVVAILGTRYKIVKDAFYVS